MLILSAPLVSLALALCAWALASPVGSSPDDDFHTANIYCLADSSTCRSDDEVTLDLPNQRELPCYVRDETLWYGPNAAVSADCLNNEDRTSNIPISTDELGYYPQAYYRFMAFLTQETLRESTVAWRLVNIALALGLACCSLVLTLPAHRQAVVVGWLVASVPFGLFLVSSINPSAWAIIGVASIMGPTVGLLGRPWETRTSSVRMAFVAIGAVMVAGSRNEGMLLVAVTLSVVFALAGRLPSRLSHRIALGLGLLVVLAIAVQFAIQSSRLRGIVSPAIENLLADPAIQTASLWDTLLSTPGLYTAAFSPPLGWLEIGMPAPVGVLGGAAFWGAAFFGLSVFFRRKLIALLLVCAVMVGVPATVLLNGQGMQARYLLPLVYVFTFVLLMPQLRGTLPEMSRAQKAALVLALGIANSLALLQVTVRYVSGLTMGATSPRAFAAHPVPDWWWDYWLSPFANWVLGSVAFATGCYLLLRNPGPLYPSPSVQGQPDNQQNPTEPDETAAPAAPHEPPGGALDSMGKPSPQT